MIYMRKVSKFERLVNMKELIQKTTYLNIEYDSIAGLKIAWV